jgi:hypothetical protein
MKRIKTVFEAMRVNFVSEGPIFRIYFQRKVLKVFSISIVVLYSQSFREQPEAAFYLN